MQDFVLYMEHTKIDNKRIGKDQELFNNHLNELHVENLFP